MSSPGAPAGGTQQATLLNAPFPGGAGRGIHNIEGRLHPTTGKLEVVIVERELARIEDTDTLQGPAAGIRRQRLP